MRYVYDTDQMQINYFLIRNSCILYHLNWQDNGIFIIKRLLNDYKILHMALFAFWDESSKICI